MFKLVPRTFFAMVLMSLASSGAYAAKADTTVNKTKAPVVYRIIIDFDASELHLTGFNFMPGTDDPVISLGGDPTPLTILSATDTNVTVTFPSDVPDGDHMLLITNSDAEQVAQDLTIDRELSESEVIAFVNANGYVSGPHYSDAQAIAAVGPHLTQTDVEAFLANRFAELEAAITDLEAIAQSQSTLILALQSDLTSAEAGMDALGADFGTLQGQYADHVGDSTAHHARYEDAEAIAAVGPHFSGDHNDLVNVTPDQHHANLADSPVFDLDPFVSVSTETINGVAGPHILIEGANVHIRSGYGQTGDLATGLGNLIIGYNEDTGITFPRTGAHNLVLGSRNGFSSYAGLVAGELNWVSGEWATITGGQWNEAQAHHSSISGGADNVTSGYAAHVSGGHANKASAFAATVSGGRGNMASGGASSVTGGFWNVAAGESSSVSGGRSIATSDDESWVAVDVMPHLTNLEANLTTLDTVFQAHATDPQAHHSRYEDAEAVAAVGPHFSGDHADLVNVTPNQHHADLSHSPIFDLEPFVTVTDVMMDNLNGPHIVFEGANIHVRSGSGSTNDGGTGEYLGLGNLIIGYNENCCGGPDNRVGSHNLVIGSLHQYTSYGGFVAGYRNELHAAYGTIAGGYENAVEGTYTSVLGGHFNTAADLATSISGGLGNLSGNHYSSISGGYQNQALGPTSTIGGGAFRAVFGDRDWQAGTLFETE